MKRTYHDSLLDPHTNFISSLQSDDCDMIKTPSVNMNFPLSEVKPSNIDLRSNQQSSNEKNLTADDKPMCSIKLIRHYVEEDDAASVITSEEGNKILM